ncbi:hypothetical protein GF318_00210 [Candidatus Micrarchaeota archaeon]|nr:hypothetical protein [Candidatus Micrarchaeota archaeon]
MPKRMDDVVEYVKRSKRRLEVLKALGKSMMNSNKVAARTDLPVSTVRPVIYDLMKNGLVKKAKKKRPVIYGTTKLGDSVLQMRNAQGRIRWKGTNRQKRIARRRKEVHS